MLKGDRWNIGILMNFYIFNNKFNIFFLLFSFP
jgi:hypothetical protein